MTTTFPPASAADLDLAEAFYAVLARQARKGAPITCGDVVTEAKALFPDNPSVQNAFAMTVGKRLAIVQAFTRQRNLPDLASLAVNKAGRSVVPASADGDDNATPSLDQVAAVDWDGLTAEFASAIADARANATTATQAPRVPKPKAISYDQAAAQMSAYYMANKATLPANIKASREAIIQRIRDGRPVEQAFAGDAN